MAYRLQCCDIRCPECNYYIVKCCKGECPGSREVPLFEDEVAMMSVTSKGSEERRKEIWQSVSTQ